MPFSESSTCHWSEIHISEDRQRDDLAISDEFVDSIKNTGQINPIIVHQHEDGKLWLVAGGRRLEVCKRLNREVCFRVQAYEDPLELEIVELEENAKREDLPWRRHIRAVGRLHSAYKKREGETWKLEDTAKNINVSIPTARKMLHVFAHLDKPILNTATSMSQAYGILERFADRVTAAMTNEIATGTASVFEPPKEESEAPAFNASSISLGIENGNENEPATKTQDFNGTGTSADTLANTSNNNTNGSVPTGTAIPTQSGPTVQPQPIPKHQRPSVLNEDFIKWASTYSGPSFNFIHCDFPYGVNTEDSLIETYENTKTIFDDLTTCLLDNLTKLMSHSAHLVFWLNMRFEEACKAKFRKAGLHVIDRPLIWHKSDMRGAAPGLKGTQPRHTYEAALLCIRGNRFLVKQAGDSFPCPNVSNPLHPTQKPEPLLRYFFQMFVDETTDMLDPTAGSGSSIKIAEEYNAKIALGLELDSNYCAAANSSIINARLLRMSSGAGR